MTMEKTVTGEIVTTFSPHGTQFSLPAELTLRWDDFGIDPDDVPTLYYIEDDGTYSEQTPDHIDVGNKFLVIYFDHFSRYALAHSE